MRMVIPKANINDLWMLLIIFICVFQPPIVPISLIYLVGMIALFFFFLKSKRYMNILYTSEMYYTYIFFLILFVYMAGVSLFNILFIKQQDLLLTNRLRCINQLLVLSLIQFICITGILNKAKKNAYTLEKIIEILVWVGMFQGILATLAYIFPDLRFWFLKFGDKNIWENVWVIERRGYGFSSTLLDTFGYGMGLLGGYAVFTRRKKAFLKYLAITFIIFSIIINSRTGIVILAIAIIIEFLFSDKPKWQLMKLFSGFCLLCILFFVVLPPVLEAGMNSSNKTITWVISGINELYQSITDGGGLELGNASYISDVNTLPTKLSEFIFGSGHSVYGTRSILGIATDIGYINNIWTYGLIGTVAIEIFFANLFIKAYKGANRMMKKVVILNATSYYLVQIKAILIGYNPGVFITYITTYAILYYAKVTSNTNELLQVKK